MNKIVIYTSGTTGSQRQVEHTEKTIYEASEKLNSYLKLNSNDVILNIFPTFTIANWVFCIGLQKVSGAKMVCPNFRPKKFWNIISDIQPTFIPIAIRTMRTMLKLGEDNFFWNPKILTGSAPIEDDDIEQLLKRGASEVWNVYGSTEFPPPILISKNSNIFDLSDMNFTQDSELIIDNKLTGDIFDLNTGKFTHRTTGEVGNTWKK